MQRGTFYVYRGLSSVLADGDFRLSMTLVGIGLALALRSTNTDLIQKVGRNPGVVLSCGHGPQFIPSPGDLTETSLTPDLLLSTGTDGHFQRLTLGSATRVSPCSSLQ